MSIQLWARLEALEQLAAAKIDALESELKRAHERIEVLEGRAEAQPAAPTPKTAAKAK